MEERIPQALAAIEQINFGDAQSLRDLSDEVLAYQDEGLFRQLLNTVIQNIDQLPWQEVATHELMLRVFAPHADPQDLKQIIDTSYHAIPRLIAGDLSQLVELAQAAIHLAAIQAGVPFVATYSEALIRWVTQQLVVRYEFLPTSLREIAASLTLRQDGERLKRLLDAVETADPVGRSTRAATFALGVPLGLARRTTDHAKSGIDGLRGLSEAMGKILAR